MGEANHTSHGVGMASIASLYTTEPGLREAIRSTHWFVWALLALPFTWLTAGWIRGYLFYGELLHLSGLISAWLLMLTMAVTPIRMLFSRQRWSGWLQRQRRYIGVASFAYAALHTIIYVYRKDSLSLIIEEGLQAPLLTGWVAFLIFILLALTSNDPAVRFLQRRWKKLHRLVYPATVLLFAHWLLTAFDMLAGVTNLLLLATIETVRVVLQSRTRRTSRPT